MSNNASSDSDNGREPDNPQETLSEEHYYYTGFMTAEMSCSVIKATNNNPVGHHSFKVDITVSNADRRLLEEINDVVMRGEGVITAVEGAYNLSARGKRRVRTVLNFLERYPIIAGDLARDRVALLRESLAYLEKHRGKHAHMAKTERMEIIRARLRAIKNTGTPTAQYEERCVSRDAIGSFLAGVLDGDGSFGLKRSKDRLQPYLALAMKDWKTVELLREFLGRGNVRQRKDGVYHYETNHPQVLQKTCVLFLTRYPLRQAQQRERMRALQWFLNDYTRNPVTLPLKEVVAG